MSKIIKILSISLLTVFSFFYTNKMIDLSKKNDPIMKKIILISDKLKVSSVNASFDKDYLTLGKKGLEVDITTSYEKMKKLGEYNENLIVYKEVSNNSLNYTYDKFIVSLNKKEKVVSIIFKIKDSKNIYNILKILKNNNINAIFFIDGKWGEENKLILEDIKKYNNLLGSLAYDNSFDKKDMNKVSKIIDKYNKNRYCYASYDNYELLDICKNLKLFTIKPKVIDKNIYTNVKKKLDKGLILSFSNSDMVVKELDLVIKYILQRGYEIKLLDNVIN